MKQHVRTCRVVSLKVAAALATKSVAKGDASTQHFWNSASTDLDQFVPIDSPCGAPDWRYWLLHAVPLANLTKVFTVSEVAGIMAAKRTPELLPLSRAKTNW